MTANANRTLNEMDWKRVFVSGATPDRLAGVSLAYDPVGSDVYLFGGQLLGRWVESIFTYIHVYCRQLSSCHLRVESTSFDDLADRTDNLCWNSLLLKTAVHVQRFSRINCIANTRGT